MEEQKVLLSVRGRQTYGDQEPDTIELVTEGTMVFRDGGWDISYEETAVTGMEGVTTTFRVEPGKVTLLRTGKLNSTMVFQENVAHDSLYQLEFGALLMTVKATRVFYDLVPDGGMVDLVYEICIENTEAGIIDYHLDIRKKFMYFQRIGFRLYGSRSSQNSYMATMGNIPDTFHSRTDDAQYATCRIHFGKIVHLYAA